MIQATRVAGDAASRQAAQLLARYLEDHPELAPQAEPGSKAAASPPDFGTLQIAVNDATERSIQPVLDRFDSQLAAQQQLADRFRYLSPAIVLQSALYDIAGSSAHRFGHFMNQASAFHSSWRSYFVPRILKKEKMTADDIASLPQYRFLEESSGTVAARLWPCLVGLAIPLIVIAAVAIRRLRSFPVAA
jgi:ABC-2 type transport system permease protein